MPRSARINRGIVLAAVAAGFTLLAACTPPLPPDVKAALAEDQITCETGTTTVSVPTEFSGAMTAVGDSLMGVCPEQFVSEVGPGESAGVTIVDRTPSAEQVASAAATFCANEPAIMVPAFAYPVTLAYNIIGLEGLVMTPEIVAGILSGSITTWDDPAIAAANEGFDLSGLPAITLMSIEQSQGSVEAMTAWLAAESPESWTAGQVGTLTAGEKFATNDELLAAMLGAEGSVAVLPTFMAYGNGLATANLPAMPAEDGDSEVIITTDDTQLAKVGAGATIATTDANGNIIASPAIGGVPNPESFDLNASRVVLQEGQPLVGWPVLGLAHAVVCDASQDPLPMSFARYLVRLAGQGSLEAFGLVSLPEPVRVSTFTPLRVTVVEPTAPTE